MAMRLKAAKLLQYCAGYWTDHVHDVVNEDNSIHNLTEKLLLCSSNNRRNFLQVRRVLESRNMDNFSTYDPDLSTVYYPLYCGLIWVTKRFIEANPAWLDAEIKAFGTPLLIATEHNDTEMIELLLTLGADKNKSCKAKLSAVICPVYYAAYLGNREAFKALLKGSVTVNVRCKYGDDGEDTSGSGTPILHTAAYWRRVVIVRDLIDSGRLDINEKDGDGCAPIFAAVSGRHLDVVRLLVEKGCDKETKGDSGKTVIHCALELRQEPIIEYLIDSIASDNKVFAEKFEKNELEWARCKRHLNRGN